MSSILAESSDLSLIPSVLVGLDIVGIHEEENQSEAQQKSNIVEVEKKGNLNIFSCYFYRLKGNSRFVHQN